MTRAGFPTVRVALTVLLAVNVLMAFVTYRRYREMLDYCAGFGRRGLECFSGGPYFRLWEALNLELLVWLLLEISAIVGVGAAILNMRREATS